MAVAVVIPFAGDCPHRLRALDWLTGRLTDRHPDWDVVIGRGDADRWVKADAVADGLAHTDADMLIVHDADVWCDATPEAVERCERWAIPHRLVHRLDENATNQMIDTGKPGAGIVRNPYVGFAGGGITVIRRDVYEDCPLDRRFVGWGQEDASWALALTTLHGPAWRGGADLYHMWHPPQTRLDRTVGSEHGRRLHRRYKNAARSVGFMRELVDEVKHGATGDQTGSCRD